MVPLIYQDNNIYYPVGTKEIIRTEQIFISPDDKFSCDILSYYCHISKNVYNEANYEAMQEYAKYDHYMGYNDLEYLVKKKSKNYKLLPAKTSQHAIMKLDESWWISLKNKKDFVIRPEKYLGRPGLPKYLNKDGEFILVFDYQQASIKDGYIIFPKKIYKKRSKLGDLKIKTRLDDETKLSEVRVIPESKHNSKNIGYTIEIVYKIEEHQLDLSKDRIIGLDFGLRNIVAIGSNYRLKPIVVKGGILKSINQYYNKRRAEIQSIYDRQPIACLLKNKKEIFRKAGPAIQTLTVKRNKKIKDVMHKYSRFIIKYCIQQNIGTIIIGHNDNWKQEINLGKKNNQNFVQIPFAKLIEMIEYKAEEIGISVIEQEESHTSKCSFLDNETIERHEIYMGKRISRGLFRSAKGIFINADIQATYNVIKKAIPKAFPKGKADRIEDVGLHPLRINPLTINRNINSVNN